MNKLKYLLFLYIIAVGNCVYAQLPNVPNTDYSTRSGTVKDLRDGKVYAYKKYGNMDWFIQNLNFAGEKSMAHPNDETGEKYGRLYQSNPGATINTWCPEGWTAPTEESYAELYKAVAAEYGITNNINYKYYPVSGETEPYYVTEIGKYLRAGGIQGTDTDGQWVSGTEIDPKAKQIGFNAIPAGVYNTNTGSFGAATSQGLMTIDDQVGSMAGFLLGGYYHYFMSPTSKIKATDEKTGNAVVWQGRNSNYYGSLRCFRPSAEEVPIVTPYPEELTVNQIISAEYEANRMKHSYKKFDHVLTGFYLPAGKTVKVKLETLQASADGRVPQIVIGTYGVINQAETEESQAVKTINLTEGLNVVDGTMHSGGMIYFRYVSDQEAPQGKVKISLQTDSEHTRAPHYIYGISTQKEFQYMLNLYDESREAMFSSDETVIVVSKASALSRILSFDVAHWIDGIHILIAEEDKISGMDDNDPNPLHHRLKKGQIRHLLTHCKDGNPHATNWYTGYPTTSQPQLLSDDYLWKNNGWGLGHEIGHQHQQSAYKIPQSTESTVNIYSYVVARYFTEARGEGPYIKTSESLWEGAKNTYLALPVEDRLYEMDDEALKTVLNSTVTKVGVNDLRFMPWEQMFILFGDDFYKHLHRIVREEEATASSDAAKAYLILKSSQIAGYDLRPFFEQWGIRILDDYKKYTMEKQLEKANLPLHPHTNEMHLVTAVNPPSWVPIQMKGITSSSPEANADDYVMPVNFQQAISAYVDYSTKKGTITDTRDGNKYHFKQYGDKDWFMQNLRYDTGDDYSVASELDTKGEYLGRYYKSYQDQSVSSEWCPPGWTVATRTDYRNLLNVLVQEYNLEDVTVQTNPKEGYPEFLNISKYLKAGGFQAEGGLWEDPWKETVQIDQVKVNEIGFNALPVGVYNVGNGYLQSSDKGTDDRIGKMANFLTRGGTTYDNYYMSSTDTKNSIVYQGRGSGHYASVRCVRDPLLDQTITFSAIPARNPDDAPFDLTAKATSGLPVSYISTNEEVAIVVGNRVRIMGPGEATIIAGQEGNLEYNPAPSVSQKLIVGDVSVKYIEINGQQMGVEDRYIVDCGYINDELSITVVTDPNSTVESGSSKGNVIKVDISKPAEIKVPIKVESYNGVTQDYTFVVEKRFAFDDIIVTRWNNTLLVNNNKNTNGGYTFKSYKWFKDGEVVGKNAPVYSEGPKKTDVLNPSGVYSVQLTTTNGQVINTCPAHVALKSPGFQAYPNPVGRGETIQITSDIADGDLSKDAVIEIYSFKGMLETSQKVGGKLNPTVTAPSLPGIYILVLKSADTKFEQRIIVK